VWFVIAAGTLAISHAFATLVSDFPGAPWLIVAGLTLFSGTATVRLPNVPAHISVSETFLFTAVLLFGPAAGVATVVLDASIINLKMSRRGLSLERALFNLAAPSLAIWLGAGVIAAFGIPPIVNLEAGESITLSRLIGPLVLFTLSYFAL